MQTNARCGWLLLQYFSCVIQLFQLYLSTRGTEAAIELSHAKIGGTGSSGGGGGGSNSIDFILFYNFRQSLLGSNKMRDIVLSYDSRFHHISHNHDWKKDDGTFYCYLVIRNYTLILGIAPW